MSRRIALAALVCGLALLAGCAGELRTAPAAPPAAPPATTTTPAPVAPPAADAGVSALAGAEAGGALTPSPAALVDCRPTLLQPKDGAPIYLLARVAGCADLVMVHQADPEIRLYVSRRMLESGGLPASAIDALPEREAGR